MTVGVLAILLAAFAWARSPKLRGGDGSCNTCFGLHRTPSAHFGPDSEAGSEDQAWAASLNGHADLDQNDAQTALNGNTAMWGFLKDQGWPWRPPTIPEVDESKL